jgi:hypothetical protein
MGLQELSSGVGIAALESGGFGSWKKVTILATGIAEALGAPLLIGAIYDRDYYCEEQITEVETTLGDSLQLACVLKRKEIENYLLVPAALERALNKLLTERRDRSAEPVSAPVDVIGLLEEITAPMKDDIVSQLMARSHDFLLQKGHDRSVLNKAIMTMVAQQWSNLDERLRLVPGKQVLAELRMRIQQACGATLTDARIAEAMSRDEIPADMRALLERLDIFRVSRPAT